MDDQTGSIIEKLKLVAHTVKQEIRAYQLLLKDSRTPKLAKLILGLAVGYALLPFDIIPDFLPIVGHLDDLIIIPGLIFLALRMIPKEIVEDCRMSLRSSFDRASL